jgi:hypothetical protein
MASDLIGSGVSGRTRSDRALLAYVDLKVDRNSKDVGHQLLQGDEKFIKDRVIA